MGGLESVVYLHVLAFAPFAPRLKKRDGVRRDTEFRPTNSPTTVIRVSRLPLQPTLIASGDAPIITSPTPTPIQIRKPTILNCEDALYELWEDYSTDHLGVKGSGAISRLHDSPRQHDDREYTHPSRLKIEKISPPTPL